MTDYQTFVVIAVTLLLTPGPTNTLLLTAGAEAGFRRSIALVAAELAGYLTSIAVLLIGIGPLIRTHPVLGALLKLVAAGFLTFVAVRLWSGRSVPLEKREPPKMHRVYVATMLNPKAIVFAFLLVPHFGAGNIAAGVSYLISLSALILVAGTIWIFTGSALGPSVEHFAGLGAVRRFGALALGFFVLALGYSAAFA